MDDQKRLIDKAVENYFSALKFRFELLKKYMEETDLLLSSRFNVFDYIYVDENKLSDIIADLLNPQGKHGQKDLFLKTFLEVLGLSDEGKNLPVRIGREVGTSFIEQSRRRMDILIEWSNYGIMLENKPWACDQHRQLADYQVHLKNRFGEGHFTILYLTHGCEGPSTDSISEMELQLLVDGKQFLKISFREHIVDWLNRSFKECQSEKVRHFIKDFHSHVVKIFN